MTNKDYNSFKSEKRNSAPKALGLQVLSNIQRELNPPVWLVTLKLYSVQAIVGCLTLFFCPQFDLSLTNNYELFHYFHHTFGRYVCMSICGSIFIGSGAFIASSILSLGEIRKIKESKFLYYSSISGVSILAFLLLGAEVYLDISLAWLVGSLIGGIASFEMNRLVRYKLLTL